MKNNKWEEFEQEYKEEIAGLKTLQFKTSPVPEFKIPSYTFIYRRALSLAFAVPALVMVFGIFSYFQTDPNTQKLSLLEESNNRILNQINTLEE